LGLARGMGRTKAGRSRRSPSPKAVTEKKAAEIAADFMTTFYQVQVGARETQEFRTTPVPFWLVYSVYLGFVWANPIPQPNNASILRGVLQPVVDSMRDFQTWFKFPWEGQTFEKDTLPAQVS
jgi:hypothetical protein